MQFDATTALVTGAAGGIGRGIARALAAEGLKVFVTDLGQEEIDAIRSEITAAGGQSSARAADVTDRAAVSALVAEAAEALGGRIDVLVNVAGIVAQAKVEDISEEEWDRIFAVNCKGTFLCIKHVVPLMKKQGFGKIINFSSKSGKTGSALMSHYSAAKAAIIGLTQALGCELAGHGITANCLCPGITEETGVWGKVSSGYMENLSLSKQEVTEKFTAKVPLRRLASIGDVVAVTLFLASRGADYMTGQAINVTGGREMH